MGVLTIRKDTSSGTVLHTEQRLSAPAYSPNPTGSITSGATWNCKNKVPNANIVVGGKTFAAKDKMMDRNFWAKYDESQPYDIYKNGAWASGLSATSFLKYGYYIHACPPVYTFGTSSFTVYGARFDNQHYGFALLDFAIPWGTSVNYIEIETGAATGYLVAYLLGEKPTVQPTSTEEVYVPAVIGDYYKRYIYIPASKTTVMLDNNKRPTEQPLYKYGLMPNSVNKLTVPSGTTVSGNQYLYLYDVVQVGTTTTIKRISLGKE